MNQFKHLVPTCQCEYPHYLLDHWYCTKHKYWFMTASFSIIKVSPELAADLGWPTANINQLSKLVKAT